MMTNPHEPRATQETTADREPPTASSASGRPSGLATLFVNFGEHRLRAGWRIVAHSMLLLAAAKVTALGAQGALALLRIGAPRAASGPSAALGSLQSLAAMACSGAIAVTFATALARWLLDRRAWVSLGLWLDRPALFEVASGFALAGLLQGLTFALLWVTGCVRLVGLGWQTRSLAETLVNALGFGVVFVLVAWSEELMWRGYWLRNAAEGLTPTAAVLISSLFFALDHGGNPNATGGAFMGVVGAGLLLAWACVRTGRLWLPIGLHLGWNWFEGPVFGLPVSGISPMSLIQPIVSGPALWTGGGFGPEAGLAQVPALALGALAIGWATRARRPRTATAD